MSDNYWLFFLLTLLRFLSVGHVVMELVKLVPEVDSVFQNILKTAFFSMATGTQAIENVTGDFL